MVEGQIKEKKRKKFSKRRNSSQQIFSRKLEMTDVGNFVTNFGNEKKLDVNNRQRAECQRTS